MIQSGVPLSYRVAMTSGTVAEGLCSLISAAAPVCDNNNNNNFTNNATTNNNKHYKYKIMDKTYPRRVDKPWKFH